VALRKPLIVIAVLALGATVGVMPAIAGSESVPTIEAVNSGAYYHYWVPATAKIAPGGSVAFSNPTMVPHGVEWIGPPAVPACDPGVKVGNTEAASGTEWHGSCTFTAPGVYRFYCTVHHAAMSGTITVGETSTTTGTTTGRTTTTTGGETTPTSGTGTTPAPPGSGAPTSLAYSALELAAPHRGRGVVRGSLTVAAAAAGGTLDVKLLAGRAQLARARSEVVLGDLTRRGIAAGPLAFRVSLNARGRAALRARGRLRVTVRITVAPPQGAATALSRSLLLRR
jgi:plastocyanin